MGSDTCPECSASYVEGNAMDIGRVAQEAASLALRECLSGETIRTLGGKPMPRLHVYTFPHGNGNMVVLSRRRLAPDEVLAEARNQLAEEFGQTEAEKIPHCVGECSFEVTEQ